MAHFMVFRAVVPPGFNLERYAEQSSEPIRYDAVTVVEADDAQEAVNAVIAATGLVSVGFAVSRVDLIGFASKSKFGSGGALRGISEKGVKELTESVDAQIESDDERLERLKREIDEIKDRAN